MKHPIRASIILLVVFFANHAAAQNTLPADMTAAIDRAVTDVLARSGAPSASIAVVQNGAIAYVHAYGNARIDPQIPATPEMRYSIGSISKQFTAAAVLMLAEEASCRWTTT